MKTNTSLKPQRSPDAEAKLQAIFDAFPDLLFLLDRDFTILDFTVGNTPILDAPPDALVGQRLYDVFPNRIGDMYIEAAKEALEKDKITSFSYGHPLADREYWYEARLVPLPDAQIAAVIRDITEYKLKEARVQTQIKRLAALRSIDLAITSSLDVNLILSILLSHVTTLLGIDAAAALIFKAQTLEYAAGLGFRTSTLQHTRLRLGEGYAGLAALERRTINITDINNQNTDLFLSSMFSQEGFVDYYAVPLITKGQVKGVLEVFHRTPLKPDPDWLDYLETVAGQAAIAIDSTNMFKDLQRTNEELVLAYNATIEGWSHALDLRDRETEGHTRRVSEMSLNLARLMSINEEAMIHLQRGALLHDIGKMGIPDNILFKPGELNDSEWVIMRQHPRYAFEMLSPIAYLNPAMEIPYYHHEKWDGTGYPQGLYKEQIPLAARVFAVADVYDALTSDRPYRSAWPCEKAREYIHTETGKHFDPQVSEIFLNTILASTPQKEVREKHR